MDGSRFRKTIAERLKAVRGENGMSLDAVSRATGVSKAMLGQIERMESSPTIVVLWKIATGLNLSFSAFFADEARPFSRGDDFPEDPDMQVSVLFPFSPDTRMEMFLVRLERGHRQDSEAHHVGVVEHVVVLSGEVLIVLGRESHRLKPGDALRFHADQPHTYQALTDTALFHNIICYA